MVDQAIRWLATYITDDGWKMILAHLPDVPAKTVRAWLVQAARDRGAGDDAIEQLKSPEFLEALNARLIGLRPQLGLWQPTE